MPIFSETIFKNLNSEYFHGIGPELSMLLQGYTNTYQRLSQGEWDRFYGSNLFLSCTD